MAAQPLRAVLQQRSSDALQIEFAWRPGVATLCKASSAPLSAPF